MNLVEEAAQHVTRDILGGLDRYGIRLGRFPNIRYVDENVRHDIGPVTITTRAAVNTGTDANPSYVAGTILSFRKYGLDVSEEAATELCEAKAKKRGRGKICEQMREHDDIVLFRDYFKLFKHNHLAELRRVTAHEVWHLAERDAGVIGQNRLIVEGTAEYAAALLSGIGTGMTDYHDDMTQFIRHDIAHMVGNAVGRKWNPLKALLKKRVRDRISGKAMERLRTRPPNARDTLGIELMEDVLSSRSFYEFMADPSKGRLLAHYRDIGAGKAADELESQDVTRLVSSYAYELPDIAKRELIITPEGVHFSEPFP